MHAINPIFPNSFECPIAVSMYGISPVCTVRMSRKIGMGHDADMVAASAPVECGNEIKRRDRVWCGWWRWWTVRVAG